MRSELDDAAGGWERDVCVFDVGAARRAPLVDVEPAGLEVG